MQNKINLKFCVFFFFFFFEGIDRSIGLVGFLNNKCFFFYLLPGQDKIDSVSSEPVPDSKEATAPEEVEEKSEETPTEIQAEQEERVEEQKTEEKPSQEESKEEVPTTEEREQKESGETAQTEDSGSDEKRAEEEPERTSGVASKFPEESGENFEEQPRVPDSMRVARKPEESLEPSVPEQESTRTPETKGLPAIPPLIPSTQSAPPAAATSRVEELAPQAGYSDRRDDYRV